MAHSLVEKGRIETTLPKARELRSFADHLVTLGKRGGLAARRQAFWFVRSENTVKKLFSEVAPLFQNRNGGYTRVLKLGHRLGDSAPMALIEYISFPETPKKASKKAAKKVVKKK
jgi:large subunit ribosomal protein L17